MTLLMMVLQWSDTDEELWNHTQSVDTINLTICLMADHWFKSYACLD